METLGLTTVVAIVAICYLIGEVIKAWTPIDNSKIPSLLGVFGMCLGIVGMHLMPDFPANDILTAIAIGGASGLAATGVNQIYKQATVYK